MFREVWAELKACKVVWVRRGRQRTRINAKARKLPYGVAFVVPPPSLLLNLDTLTTTKPSKPVFVLEKSIKWSTTDLLSSYDGFTGFGLSLEDTTPSAFTLKS